MGELIRPQNDLFPREWNVPHLPLPDKPPIKSRSTIRNAVSDTGEVSTNAHIVWEIGNDGSEIDYIDVVAGCGYPSFIQRRTPAYLLQFGQEVAWMEGEEKGHYGVLWVVNHPEEPREASAQVIFLPHKTPDLMDEKADIASIFYNKRGSGFDKATLGNQFLIRPRERMSAFDFPRVTISDDPSRPATFPYAISTDPDTKLEEISPPQYKSFRLLDQRWYEVLITVEGGQRKVVVTQRSNNIRQTLWIPPRISYRQLVTSSFLLDDNEERVVNRSWRPKSIRSKPHVEFDVASSTFVTDTVISIESSWNVDIGMPSETPIEGNTENANETAD